MSTDQHYKRWKPKGYENHFTLSEVCRIVNRDQSWITRLEKDDRIPIAMRVKVGQVSVRLYSQEQIDEIVVILSKMKRGPKPKEVADAEDY